MKPLLSVRNLKTYFHQDEGTVKAVDGISFDIYPGQILAVVGESGCGKSITARSLLQILDRSGKIEQGEILLTSKEDNGSYIDIAALHPHHKTMRQIRGKEISLVFQEPMTSFSPVHTIGNQIMEVIRLHTRISKEKAKRITIETLERVGIPSPEDRFKAYPFQLSGGLRQRAMIAMALICKPRLLIADEPTTALDVTLQAQILDLLKELQVENDMAIMIITHDLGVVAQIADEVIVMYLGRIAEKGSVYDIFENPKHPYTQALLNSMPGLHSNAEEKLNTITGFIPHPLNRPEGCPFHNRCPHVIEEKCQRSFPATIQINSGHEVNCFLYEREECKD